MAINDLILSLQRSGIPATVEHPGGKWTHSDEYLALRAGGTAALIRCLKRKIALGDAKANLQLALLKNDPSLLCEQTEGAENG